MPAPARRPGHVTVRGPFYAWRFNYRVLVLSAIALIVLAIVTTWAMTLGSFPIAFTDVVRAVFGRGTEDHEFVVRSLRLPRVLSAVMIGALLAMSGAIFQGMVRNPLVSPDIIGIDAGAAAVAVFWIATRQRPDLLPVAALVGALVTALLIYVLSWKGGIAPDRLILVGIGIGAAAAAMTTFVLVRFPVEQARPAQVWTLGSIYGSNWSDVRWLLGTLLVFGTVAIGLMWPLRVLQFGDDITRGLGVSLERTRLLLIVVGCVLAAVCVSVAGPIGFVALMVPHVGRSIAGPLAGSVLIFTGIIGALFLLLADVIAQHYLPVDMPVGVVTAGVGAPYFLYLLYRSNVRL